MYYEKIKSLCDERGITVMELEKRAGLGNGVIGGWRESEPKISSLKAVADVLGIPITELINDND